MTAWRVVPCYKEAELGKENCRLFVGNFKVRVTLFGWLIGDNNPCVGRRPCLTKIGIPWRLLGLKSTQNSDTNGGDPPLTRPQFLRDVLGDCLRVVVAHGCPNQSHVSSDL